MKNLVLVLCVLISTCSYGENKVIETEAFTSVKANGHVSVHVIVGDSYKADIKCGIELDKVNVEVKKGELVISVMDGKYKEEVPEITVYTKEIFKVRAFGNAIVKFLENHQLDKFEVEAQAGGHLHVKVKSKRLDAKVSQGGRITLAGSTDILDVNINTGGVIAGYGINSKDVIARIKAGGEIFVHPKQGLDARVTAGGTIYYKGNPEPLKTKTLGGKILQFGEK